MTKNDSINEKEVDYGKIVIPDWRNALPIEDSILLLKIKNSKNFGLAYLCLCERLQKEKVRIRSGELASALHLSNAYAYQLLQVFCNLGYFRMYKTSGGRGGATYFLPKVPFDSFITTEFVQAAKKWLD